MVLATNDLVILYFSTVTRYGYEPVKYSFNYGSHVPHQLSKHCTLLASLLDRLRFLRVFLVFILQCGDPNNARVFLGRCKGPKFRKGDYEISLINLSRDLKLEGKLVEGGGAI